ncbi:hypothetical protein BXY82_2057 [Gelidibacter sediminis]|uniref:Uncharacterized protein n=1 Tax=Gelidibacter sediminis TaxID=1608710 RepID=A0A4R7PYH7_9FLAO|nr:hypothetical protein [Gelidibacter sediminis]TDU40018.1 hypothetical protein BXY82_2057 [Gelidibacter sediminis]
MDKQQQTLKNLRLKSQETGNKSTKKKFLLGSILATLIAGSPFLFYLYNYVPPTPEWETFLFTYNSGFYENAQTAMWMLTGKLITLFFLIIWFFTCRHWWYHALLAPIAMFIYQIIGAVLQDTVTSVDDFDLIYLLPVMAIIIPSIYLIRAKVFNKINDADKTLQELEEEFKIKPKGVIEKLSDYF